MRPPQEINGALLFHWTRCRQCAAEARDYESIGRTISSLRAKDNPVSSTYPSLARQFTEASPNAPSAVSPFSNMEVEVACDGCGRRHQGKMRSFIRLSSLAVNTPWLCEACVFTRSSAVENSLAQWIETVVDEKLVRNSRTVIAPLELDIYLPNRGLAVEFNGDYWHGYEHFVRVGKKNAPIFAHRHKREIAEEVGLSLAFVWEQDWINRPGEVKEELLHFFETRERGPLIARTAPMDEPFEVGLFAA